MMSSVSSTNKPKECFKPGRKEGSTGSGEGITEASYTGNLTAPLAMFDTSSCTVALTHMSPATIEWFCIAAPPDVVSQITENEFSMTSVFRAIACWLVGMSDDLPTSFPFVVAITNSVNSCILRDLCILVVAMMLRTYNAN